MTNIEYFKVVWTSGEPVEYVTNTHNIDGKVVEDE